MIGVVVITHASLACALREAAELILGPQQSLATICIDRDRSVEQARADIRNALEAVAADGEGVMILTDMFGGTPTNISAEFLTPGWTEIITGVNLPMLIKCLSARHGRGLDDLAGDLKEYGQKAVMRPAELLS